MEAIEIEGLRGEDYTSRCNAPNLGILRVSYPVDDLGGIVRRLNAAGWPLEYGPGEVDRSPYGKVRTLTIRLPDGGLIEFFSQIRQSR